MKRFYLKELEELRNHLLLMAEMAANAVAQTLHALENNDPELARKILAEDDLIDDLEIRISAEASRYITLRSPVATDMRLVTAAMKASHDLERIGDEASSICKRIIRLSGNGRRPEVGQITRVGELVLSQIREAVDCLIEVDPVRAGNLPAKDREVDQMHRENYAQCVSAIEASPASASAHIDLIFISKSLERIGDHATNIAEEIVYLYQGEDIRHSEKVRRAQD